MADQHGSCGEFLKTWQPQDRVDSVAQGVNTKESNQRESVQSVVIRVPFESVGELLGRGSR
ncbi:MAG: hypothetical protein DWQ34_19105 [Planctomycetota bacterium]|nr:MAG: hypothetical protein DWQ29_09680 [Planctomycetota bacterium]REJ89632.1 MAG: hypothetical protein DWQ34_19105 [Planctomycetota bacterium]REK24343.1 MAG: hypothetical protein DWQ41_15075 [Planctomycetota bacterium]REK38534.1 MAG: hypothetical protein DWQ45_03870 [Planctomycetota bacterium]